MKKIISILLCLALCLGLLPGTAAAVEVTDALDLTSQNTDVSGDGYSWAADTKTLTLTNFTQTISDSTEREIAIALPENATLVLEGESTITNSSLGGTCVQYEGNLTVQGEGTLNLNLYMQTSNTCGKGIYEKSDTKTDNILTIKGGTLNITGKEENTNSNGYVGISGAEVHLDGGTVNMKNITYGVNAYYWWVEARKFLVNGGTFQYSKENDYTCELRYSVSGGSNRNDSGFSQVSITSGTVDISGALNAFSVAKTPVSVIGGSLNIHDLVRQTAASGIVQNTHAFLCGSGSATVAEPKIMLTGGNIEISGCDYILSAVNTLGMDMLEVGENMALTGLVRVDQYGIYPENESLGVSQVRIYGDYTLTESISFHEGNSGFWDIGLSEGSTLTIPEGMTFDLSKMVRRGEDFGISGPGDVYDLSGGTIINNGILALPNVDADEIPAYIKTLDITGSGRVEVRNRNAETAIATYTNSGMILRDPAGTLDFSSASTNVSDTAKGYSWDAATKTLTLDDGFNATTVTLPDGTVTINTAGASTIDKLAFQNNETVNLIFTGEGPLTVNQQINIASGDYNTLTVNENTNVIANGGIYIGETGGVNSIITVNGTLTAKGDTGTAIQAGSVAIGDTGTLNVSGMQGVLLSGMPRNTGAAYNNLFTVEGNGCFTADCSEYNIQVTTTDENKYPKNDEGKIDAGAVIHLGADYLPDDCKASASADGTQINLVRKSTGSIYTGSITIHQKHEWSNDWTKDGSGHWHSCTVEGCDKRQPGSEKAHSLSWQRDGIEHWQECSVCGWTSEHAAHSLGTAYKYDSTGHWKECVDCGSRTAVEQHVYDSSSDTSCDTCGYTRTIDGGGSVSTYAITVEKSEHGKVTANKANASSGSTVMLTVTPDSGYVLDTLTVTDSQGNEVKLTDKGNGKYTFIMPGRAVTVQATFAGDTQKPCDGGADCPSRGFADLGGVGTWYHEAVDYALRNELMDGYGGGLFGPDDDLSRAQLTQILYNKEGNPAVRDKDVFVDVASGAWFTPAVTWASTRDIVVGYGNGLFGPDDPITREQLAAMLWRYAGRPASAKKDLDFADTGKISDYALEAVEWAVEQGIMQGRGNGILDPRGNATRAEVATMLMRLRY